MKILISLCKKQVSQVTLLLLTMIAVLSGTARANDYTPIDPTWKLTFDEEFNGSAIDPSKWYVANGPAGSEKYDSDTGKWSFSPNDVYERDQWSSSPTNVAVSQGNAVLSVTQAPASKDSNAPLYNCGGINTLKFTQQCGYWEARIKMPANAQGMLNAFWLSSSVNDGAMNPPEIDMVEWLGCDLTGELLHQHFYNFDPNPNPDDNGIGNGYAVEGLQDLSAAYHVYGMLWTPAQITFYLDGVEVREVNCGLDSAAGDMLYDILGKNAPPEIQLQSYHGGRVINPNNLENAATVYPSSMLVDYVHVYSNMPGAPAATPQPGYGGPGDTSPIINCGFETGANWSTYAVNASVVTSFTHSGTYAAQLEPGGTEDQIICGLQPNTSYTLTGWILNQDGDQNTYIGVKNYGGSEIAVPVSSTSYTQTSISFTTGAASTSAEIYVWKPSGTKMSYADDFQLTNNGPSPSNMLVDPSFESGNNWSSAVGASIVSSVTGYQTSAPFAGRYCASIANQGYESQWVQVQPNTTYLLSSNVLNPAGTSYPAELSVGAYNGSLIINDTVSAACWSRASFPFTTGPSATNMYVQFWKQMKDSNFAYADNFSLTQVSTVTLPNAGFESGANWPGKYGNATVVSASQDSNIFDGQYAAKLLYSTGNSAAEDQTVTGLQPNTTYTLSCICRNLDADSQTALGVKYFNNSGDTVQNPISSWYYVPSSVTFTTGPTNTTADIYFWKNGGSNASYADDFILYCGS